MQVIKYWWYKCNNLWVKAETLSNISAAYTQYLYFAKKRNGIISHVNSVSKICIVCVSSLGCHAWLIALLKGYSRIHIRYCLRICYQFSIGLHEQIVSVSFQFQLWSMQTSRRYSYFLYTGQLICRWNKLNYADRMMIKYPMFPGHAFLQIIKLVL